MTFLGFSKVLSRGVVGVVGLSAISAIAAFGITKPADAANILAGSDYWYTTPGASFDFGGPIGIVNFKGKANGPVGTDTQVARIDNCVFSPAYPALPSSCSSRLEMRNLSLESVAPVNIGGFLYDVMVGLNSNTPSTGTITIYHQYLDDNTPAPEGTFDSHLNVNFTASFTPTNGGANIGPISDTTILDSTGGLWSHDPLPGTPIVTGPVGDTNANTHNPPLPPDYRDFYIVSPLHQCNGPNNCHPVVPSVPEPSNTAAIAILGLGSLVVGIKRKGNLIQK